MLVVVQKRGRKGDKIKKALMAVTTIPQDVEIFIREHQISLPVLRQSKRFCEQYNIEENIIVKQYGEEKKLHIWKDQSSENI